ALLHGLRPSPRLGLRGPAAAYCVRCVALVAPAGPFDCRPSSVADLRGCVARLCYGNVRARIGWRGVRASLSLAVAALRPCVPRFRQLFLDECLRAALLAGLRLDRRADCARRIAQ